MRGRSGGYTGQREAEGDGIATSDSRLDRAEAFEKLTLAAE